MSEKLSPETLDDLAEEVETLVRIGDMRSGDLDWLQQRFYRTHPLATGRPLELPEIAGWLRERASEERGASS